jgi:hypothetical protein
LPFRILFSFALVALALAPWNARAQTSTGTIAGHVTDPQGEAVPGAAVTVKNTDLSTARTATTDAQGNFRFPALTSGAFTVEARTKGLATRRPVRVTLSVGSIVQVEIPIAIPQVKQSTTVRARAGNVEGNTVAPEINKEEAAVGIFLPGLTVTYLPNRDRDYNQFVELTPGAQEDASGNGVLIAGQRSSALMTQLDGVSFNDPLLGGERGAEDRGFFLPQTVVREFQVLHAGVSAEVGGTNAGLVNIVTKAGSGKLHGEFFYTGRPSQLTSADAFGHTLANTQNTFGGSTGGPFGGRLKNKAFYYAGFEQDILHVPTWVQFQSQAVPASPASIALFSEQGQLVQHSTPSAFFARIDLNPSAKDTVALELGLNRIHATNFPDALNAGASTQTYATQSNTATEYGQSATGIAAWTHVLRPSLVNQATVAWSSDHRGLTPNSTAPELYINGFGILGGNSFGTELWTSRQAQVKDNVTLAHGDSVTSFGGLFAFDPAYQQQEANLNGRFDYSSLTDYLDNNPRRYQQTFPVGDIRYRGSVKEVGLYANERFTLRKTLTLTAGMRWAGQFNPQPDHPLTAVPIIDGVSNPVLPVTISIPNDGMMWQPRLGLAWNLRPKTVVRLSAGLLDANTAADLFHRVFTDNGARVTIADSYFDPTLLPLALANGTSHPLSFLPALTTPEALVIGIAPSFRNPTSGQFAASVERQTTAKIDLTLGYLHNSTWHLQRRLDKNLNPPISSSGDSLFGSRPVPGLGRLLVNQSEAHSTYDGLLFTGIAQISRRTTITANYTLARAIDDDSNEGPFSFDTALNPFHLKAEAGPSSQDVRQNLNVAAILNLPAGLKFNPVYIQRSGLPYTPLIGFDTQHDANDFNDRTLNVNGPAGRNSGRQPGLSDLDVRLVKDFTLKGEGHHLDLFMDVFNVVGSQNRSFGPASSSLFGNASSPVNSGGQALFAPDTTRLGGPREFQFTARLVGF